MGSKRDKERFKNRTRASSKSSTAGRHARSGRGGSERRSSERRREEDGASPRSMRRHVRRGGRHDSRQPSSSPSMPRLSAVRGLLVAAEVHQPPKSPAHEEVDLPSNVEVSEEEKNGEESDGGGDGKRRKDGNNNGDIPSEPELVDASGVRITALENNFSLLSEKLDGLQELMMSQFSQPKKRRSASPTGSAPGKRRRRHDRRSPARVETEEESVSDVSEGGQSAWKPFDPTNKTVKHPWVADDNVLEETEKYFKHSKQCRGADLEAWQQKYNLPDNAPSTMVVPAFNENVSRAVLENDKKQGDVIVSHDKSLKSVHTNLVQVGTPLINLWQLIQRSSKDSFEELQLDMIDCVGTALLLLGSAHSHLAFTRRSFIAESSQKTFRDLFRTPSEDNNFLFPPDLGTKAKDLSSESKVLSGMLTQAEKRQTSSRRGGRRTNYRTAGGGNRGYRYNYMPRPNYSRPNYGGSRQYYNKSSSQSFQKQGDGKKSDK
ncbi:uncharacterized protein LOC144864029 [Branchiostoma floridae x Branchiostoma japonicum]